MSETNDRAAMLEKLNDAFERAIETEKPQAPPEPEQPAFEHVSHDVEGLYGDEAGKHNESPAEKTDDEYDDEWDDDMKPVKKKGKAGLIIGIILGSLIVLLLAGATIIAEPWVKAPVDSYTAPTEYTVLPDVTIPVSEDYFFDNISLGENEVLSKVEIDPADSDILSTNGVDLIHSAGEYFGTTVRVTTSEEQIMPLTTYKDFSLFGKDLSGPYNSIRSKLRDLLGVEKTTADRTELRVLGLYEMNVIVDGLAAAPADETVEASTSRSVDITPTVGADEDIVFTCADSSVTVTSEEETSSRTAYTFTNSDDEELLVVKHATSDDGDEFYINGRKSGSSTTVLAEIGFWKTVDAETYARYLEATGQTAAPATDEEETGEDTEEPAANRIFVPTSAISYVVTVA